MFPPDKLCKLPRPGGDESVLDRSSSRDPISSHRPENSLKFAQLRPIANERVTEEFACARRDKDCIWRRYVPQSGSHGDSFSDGWLIFADKD
jgi:hypothetical protein